MSAEAVGCRGVWLQVVLLTANERRQLSASEYAKAVVGLAHHAHSHLALTGQLLHQITLHDREDLSGLKAALRFVATPAADMRSHRAVFREFLDWLWGATDGMPVLRKEAATSLSLGALLDHRERDWRPLLIEVIVKSRSNLSLSHYLSGWLKGHFITREILLSPATPEAANGRRRSKKVA